MFHFKCMIYDILTLQLAVLQDANYKNKIRETKTKNQKNAMHATQTKKTDKNKHRPSPEEQLVVFRIEDPRIPFVPRNRQ